MLIDQTVRRQSAHVVVLGNEKGGSGKSTVAMHIAVALMKSGQRVATLVMYLNEPAQGGGTTFPDVNFEVAPQRGNAVFFSYDRPHPSTRSLHGGAPVLAGEKWIATKWLREREFV